MFRHEEAREKTNSDRDLIKQALKGNLVCSSLNEAEIEALCEAMKFYVFTQGELVCQQGAMGSHFFIIHSGQFEVSINGKVVNHMVLLQDAVSCSAFAFAGLICCI